MASRRALPSATRRSIRARVVSQRRRTSATRQGATFASRFPPRLGRCRCCLPDGASTGDTPQSAAKDASECKRWGLSPPAIISAAATLCPTPLLLEQFGRSDDGDDSLEEISPCQPHSREPPTANATDPVRGCHALTDDYSHRRTPTTAGS